MFIHLKLILVSVATMLIHLKLILVSVGNHGYIFKTDIDTYLSVWQQYLHI